MKDRTIRRKYKSRMDAKQDIWRSQPALMGDGAGVIEVPGQPGYVYIRVGSGDLGQAFNNRCPLADNLAIEVGYDPITDPDRRIFQVLSVRMADYASAGNTNTYPNVPSHHTSHEFGGGDDVYVNWRRLMGFRVGRPSGFSVTVDSGVIIRAGAWTTLANQTIDLTAHVPAGLLVCYVLIYLNAAGVASHTAGAAAVGATIASCPIPGAGEIPLAAVRLYGTQTAIGDIPTAPDIVDLRFPQAAMTGSTAAGGLDTQVQYNNGGFLDGDAGFTWDDTLGVLTLYSIDADTQVDIKGSSFTARTATVLNTPGDSIGVYAGDGNGNGAGGGYSASAGVGGATGNGGTVLFIAGDGGAASGNGGNVEFVGGSTHGGGSNGGIITLTPGTPDGAGVAGVVRLQDPISVIHAIFNTASLAAADKTFTFPNASGTFTLGTGTQFQLALWDATNTVKGLGALGSAGAFLRSAGAGADPAWSTLILPNAATTGDILYASGANTIGNLADVAVGQALVSGGVGAAPTYSATPTLTGLTLSGLTASTVIYSNAAKAITSLANGAGVLTNDGAGGLSWGAAGGVHNILSATHTDSVVNAVTRGSLIYGNSTPAWDELVIGGAAGSFIRRDANDVMWSTLTLPNAATTGDILYASGANAIGNLVDVAAGQPLLSGGVGVAPAYAGWTLSGTAGGTTNLAVTNTKTLTLTATDNWNLTIPATGTATLGTGAATRVAYWSDANTLTSDADFTFDGSQLALAVQGNTGGILCGGDVLLYRGSANTWRTPDSLTVDGTVGISSSAATDGYITILPTTTITAGSIYGINDIVFANPGAASSATYYGYRGGIRTTAGNAQNLTGSFRGLESNNQHLGSGTLTAMYGVLIANSVDTGVVTTGYGLYVSAFGATTGGSFGTKWAIYCAGTTDPVYVGAEVRVDGDVGGLASCNTLTGTSDVSANSTGVGTIKFKGATSRDSTGFIKIYIGTTAYYVPVFAAITG